MEHRNPPARWRSDYIVTAAHGPHGVMIQKQNSRHHPSAKNSPFATQEFSKFAHAISLWTGHPIAFLLAFAVVIAWVVTGPLFNYSDTWQLVINTGTTIVTFLMVFLIQNTQNRDTLAIQLKLSELVLAMKGAENKFAAIEDLSDEGLEELHEDCRARAETTLQQIEGRKRRPRNRGRNSQGVARATKTPALVSS
jgi:low affinity Fe/Cu permease